jgi:NADH dehydrogenase (ubiquinone) Fe-S protein 3
MYLVFKNIIPYIVYQKYNNENSLVISVENLAFSLKCLKNHYNYKYTLLSCLSGVDLLGSTYRFSVVYDILSLTYNSRLRVKVFINEVTAVPSACNIYVNSNWWEREVWDMYGIYFENHPDLRRILTDYGFEGHPLRKDFPLYGYLEVRYDESKKRVVLEPLELSQAFRQFNFETPW